MHDKRACTIGFRISILVHSNNVDVSPPPPPPPPWDDTQEINFSHGWLVGSNLWGRGGERAR